MQCDTTFGRIKTSVYFDISALLYGVYLTDYHGIAEVVRHWTQISIRGVARSTTPQRSGSAAAV